MSNFEAFCWKFSSSINLFFSEGEIYVPRHFFCSRVDGYILNILLEKGHIANDVGKKLFIHLAISRLDVVFQENSTFLELSMAFV